MALILGQDLVFCLVGDKPIFLDLRRDRYFMLSAHLEAIFLAVLANEEVPEDSLEPLQRMRVLESTTDRASPLEPTRINPPHRRVAENTAEGGAHVAAAALEIAWLTIGNRSRLRYHGFAACINRLRDRKGELSDGSTPENDDVAAHAAQFQRARYLLPLSNNCLIDSLTLMDFLRRRKTSAALVIGVQREPFSAHCWVQSKTLLLNEEADRVAAFTPILAI